MSSFRQKRGIVTFWLTWPGIWIVLRFSQRTRIRITAENKVLVVKSWLGNGKWNLPGGGIKSNESALTAVIREVKEETGLTITEKQLTRTEKRMYKSSGLRFQYLEFTMELAKIVDVVPQIGELSDIAWVEVGSLNIRNANYDVLMALKS